MTVRPAIVGDVAPAVRLLSLRDAAAYCGLPVRNFRKHIGIQPIRLGPHERWDRQKLDAYIDGLQGKQGKVTGGDWRDAVERF